MGEKSIEEKRKYLVDYFQNALIYDIDSVGLLEVIVYPLYNMIIQSVKYWRNYNTDENNSFVLEKDIEWKNLSKSEDFSCSQRLVQKFYEQFGIKIDFDALIQNGAINIIFYDESDFENFGKSKINSFSGSIEYVDGNLHLEAADHGLVLDSVIYAHEIGHYINDTGRRPTSVRNLLTESVAFLFELLFTDYLKDNNFEYEATLQKRILLYNLYYDSLDALDLLRFFIIFLKNGDIKSEDYGEDFEKAVERCYKLIKEQHAFLKRISYSIAFSLSIYMYIQYKKNNEFMEKIMRFNASLMEGNQLLDTLDIIGITKFDNENMQKIISAFDEFKSMLGEYFKESKPKM